MTDTTVAEVARQLRARAASKVLATGHVTPEQALAFVCWPSRQAEELSMAAARQVLAEQPQLEQQIPTRERVRELVAAGRITSEIAQELGISFWTVRGIRRRGGF